jgi:tetratricopeptide (TPR) repeat protein
VRWEPDWQPGARIYPFTEDPLFPQEPDMSEQPSSSDLERILQLQKEGKFEQAILLGTELHARHPRSHHLHKKMAHVYEAMKQPDDAIREISEAIGLAPGEPDYHFTRARWYLDTGQNTEAVTDCSTAIEIETSIGWSYYMSSAYFIRALAKLQLNDYNGVLDDCALVDNEMAFWALGKLQSKVELVEQAKRHLGDR